ncbi:MAG: hypothetical protein JJ895_14740 [Balneolaceae bacterium]|nr:hypothetical protein [Balneolaceae bacterium]
MHLNRLALVCLLFSVLLLSCERDRVINPFEDNIGTYSAYGALDVDKDLNSIRIRNVSNPFLVDSIVGYEDVSVFFSDFSTNTEVQLQDTIINFNGNYTYNYLIREDLQPASQYGITIRFDGDQESKATFTTPGLSFADTTPDKSSGCFQLMRISFKNIKRPEYVRAEVGVIYQGEERWAEIKTVDQIDYVEGRDEMEVKLTVTNLLVDIFPPPPEATINIPPRLWLPTVRCQELDVYTLFIRYIHFGPEWEIFRGTDFLDLTFIDSETIENGLGFIGAIKQGATQFIFEF